MSAMTANNVDVRGDVSVNARSDGVSDCDSSSFEDSHAEDDLKLELEAKECSMQL